MNVPVTSDLVGYVSFWNSWLWRLIILLVIVHSLEIWLLFMIWWKK